MNDDASKLPEWPDRQQYHEYHKRNGLSAWAEDSEYYDALSDAALARMDALRQYVTHDDDCATQADWVNACNCGLSELLAACERSER